MTKRAIGWARVCALALFGLVAGMGWAWAAPPTTVNCAANASALVTLTSGGLMGPGEYQIEGKCVGNVTLTVPGVELDTSATGPTPIQIEGCVTIAGSDITLGSLTSGLVIDGASSSGCTAGVTLFGGETGIFLNGITIQNFPTSGIFAGGPGSMFIEGGLISGNTNCGLVLVNGMNVELDALNDNSSFPVVITGNGAQASSQLQCGIDVQDNALLVISQANVHDNLGGPALLVFQSTVDIFAGTFQSPSSVTEPTALFENAKISIESSHFTGSGHSDVIFATPGTSIILQSTSVTESDATATDATILIEDGSTLLSRGGNTITNSGTNGTAISIGNASSFKQKIETNIGVAIAADVITGKGSVTIESNMDLGTGSSAPSTWNGSITVSQNSSFRMQGGMTINGSVTVAQASNAFFNLANNPGTSNNVITGSVLCPFTTNQSSHAAVAGNSAVTAPGGSTSAVTFGSAANNCLAF